MNSRTLLSIAFATAWTLPVLADPIPIDNPGFEKGMKDWTNTGKTKDMASADEKAACTGKMGLRIVDKDSALGSNVESSTIKVTQDKDYRVSFQARALDGSKGCGIYLRFRDKDGKELPEAKTVDIPTTGEWTALSFDVTAPMTAVKATIWVHSYSTATGTWELDDFKVEEIKEKAAAPTSPGVKPDQPATAQPTPTEAPKTNP